MLIVDRGLFFFLSLSVMDAAVHEKKAYSHIDDMKLHSEKFNSDLIVKHHYIQNLSGMHKVIRPDISNCLA